MLVQQQLIGQVARWPFTHAPCPPLVLLSPRLLYNMVPVRLSNGASITSIKYEMY